MANSPHHTNSVDFKLLTKPITYQLLTPHGWTPITRAVYSTIKNPQNRRILLRDEQKIINSELIKI